MQTRPDRDCLSVFGLKDEVNSCSLPVHAQQEMADEEITLDELPEAIASSNLNETP